MGIANRYTDTDRIAAMVRRGRHRQAVGGMWDEIGGLQFAFLKQHGLRPNHSLLDLGCGSLRGGVKFIEYLDVGNYFGVDANQSLLDAGYDIELRQLGLQARLPRSNLICDDAFELDRFERTFDFALALSLFTHLSLNRIRVCLERLFPRMNSKGVLFATYFGADPHRELHKPQTHQPGGVTTYAARDPFHYRFDDFAHLAADHDWMVEPMVEFCHPRGQKMLRFSRGRS